MFEEGKTGKYLKYANGEIILVVIGILIALKINNWNEQNKGQGVANSYIKSLQADLENDLKAFENLIGCFEMELAKNLALAKRLSSPTANTDTIKKIARYEFLPYFNPTNELNMNTFNALIATGHIDLLNGILLKKYSNIMPFNYLFSKDLNSTLS